MVTVGTKGHYEMTVPEEQLAVRVGSGEVAVFATPMMIAAIEHTAIGEGTHQRAVVDKARFEARAQAKRG